MLDRLAPAVEHAYQRELTRQIKTVLEARSGEARGYIEVKVNCLSWPAAASDAGR